MLNAGFRIPPSAGTASGVHGSEPGYNRVYVHVGEDFTYEKFWQRLKAGRCFVTNGPLLRVRVDGELPGHVFTAAAGEEKDVTIEVDLASRENVPFLEVIKNGRVERQVAFDKKSGTVKVGTLKFKQSGWFAVRAVTDVEHTYRFAMTGPYYVEIGAEKQHISKVSARFFLEMVDDEIARVQSASGLQSGQKDDFLSYCARARKFWEGRVGEANAD